MLRKPDTQEPSICVVCAWRQDCVKKFSFTGQHCLEFTRDVALKKTTEGPEPERKPEQKS
jgi:hypothetical protein